MSRWTLPLRRAAYAAATAVALLAVAPGGAQACNGSGTSYIGSICVVAFDFCPRGTVEAKGTLLSPQEMPALVSLIGSLYGGDGRQSFAVPDFRGRMAVGEGQGPGLPLVTLAEWIGLPSVTLLVPLPAHRHVLTAKAADGTSLAAAGVWPANPVGSAGLSQVNSMAYRTTAAGAVVELSSSSLAPTGVTNAAMTVPNQMPALGLRTCIVTDGAMYPLRS